MNVLTPLNAARSALLLTNKPVWFGENLDKDSSGLVRLPPDKRYYVIWMLTGEPTFQWAQEPYGTTTLQVAAWSIVEGEPYQMLLDASGFMRGARFTPGLVSNLGRTGEHGGATNLTGAAQTWERTGS